jgi:GxxExxY protein
MTENEIAAIVFECAKKVHDTLGPGLLESSYEECLCFELNKSGLLVERQKPLPIIYEEIKLEAGYRVDILVENKVIIELKAIEQLAPIHAAQLLTYLRLSGCKLGLLINFNVEYIGKDFKRIVNNL